MLYLFIFISLWNGFAQEMVGESIESLYQKKQFKTIVQEHGAKVKELGRYEQFLIAQSYAHLGHSKNAIQVFEIMLERHPKDAPARRKLAEIFRKEKKYDLAIKHLKQAIEVNPNYEPAYIDLADTILEVKPRNRVEARLIYEDMLKKFGKKVEYLSRICDLAAKEGQHTTAETACKQTLQISPSDPIALITLGHLIRDRAEFEKADEYFTKLLEEHGENPQIAAACGDYFKERKQLAKAFEAFQKAAESEHATYEHFIKAGTLACEMFISDKCYQIFEKSCTFSRDPRPEIRRSLNLIKSTISSEMRNKFDELILRCVAKKP